MQNLKTRFMLLVFMLLLNTSNIKLGPGTEIQTRLLTNLNKTWPSLVTNSSLTAEPEDKSESIMPAKTWEQVNKVVDAD